MLRQQTSPSNVDNGGLHYGERSPRSLMYQQVTQTSSGNERVDFVDKPGVSRT